MERIFEDVNFVCDTYFESHITIEPIYSEVDSDNVKILAAKYKFKLAKLLMQKKGNNELVDSYLDAFMTGHSKDLNDLKLRTVGLCKELLANGYQIFRYKIEYTVLDSRLDNIFEIELTSREN